MAKRGQNEGSIYQRKDGLWVASINLGWKNGRRNRQDYYGETRREVQAKLAAALGDIQKGLPIAADKQTVREYLNWWLEDVVKRRNRPTTYTSYERLVRLYIAPCIGGAPLAKLTTAGARDAQRDA